MRTTHYRVKPLTQTIRRVYQRKIEISASITHDEKLSFWDFLLLDFKRKLYLIIYKFLKNSGKIIEIEEEIAATVEYVEISDDDIFNACQRHINDYYHVNGRLPKYLFMGTREMRSLLDHEYCKQLRVYYPSADIPDQLSRYFDANVVISPWLEGFFCWSGEGLKLKE